MGAEVKLPSSSVVVYNVCVLHLIACDSMSAVRWKHGFAWAESKFATWCQFLMPSCRHNREGTNIKVRVEIETQPRGARQSSLSSILSSRSLSVESLGHSKSQSHDYPCASELEERRERGGGDGGEQDMGETPGGDGAVYPVFETDSVWGPPVQASHSTGDRSAFFAEWKPGESRGLTLKHRCPRGRLPRFHAGPLPPVAL